MTPAHRGTAPTPPGCASKTVECANCTVGFRLGSRPAAFCSAACGAEAAAVRFGRRARARFGDDLPAPSRATLHRMVVHAVLECAPEKWARSGLRRVRPPQAEASHDDTIPDADTFARKVAGLRTRVLSPTVLRPCDVPDWDTTWRSWVRRRAG